MAQTTRLLAIVVAGIVVALSGCGMTGRELDPERLEQVISEQFSEMYGEGFTIRCPEGIPLGTGVISDCEVSDGVDARVLRVTQDDDQGHFRWELTAQDADSLKPTATQDADSLKPTAAPDPSALPTGVLGAETRFPFAVPYGTAPADAPVLELWFDFQCPLCATVEVANGDGIVAAAQGGEFQLIWRPAAFLDMSLDNDSSSRAIAAWGCAIDQGKTAEYHQVLFVNHPTPEGTGFTDAQLLGYAGDAGIAGEAMKAFTQCFEDRTYLGWATSSTHALFDNAIPGVPHATINGRVIENAQLADPTALAAAIAAAQ